MKYGTDKSPVELDVAPSSGSRAADIPLLGGRAKQPGVISKLSSRPAAAVYMLGALIILVEMISRYWRYRERATCAAGTSLASPPGLAENCFNTFAPAVNSTMRMDFCASGNYPALVAAASLSAPASQSLHHCLSEYERSSEAVGLLIGGVIGTALFCVALYLCIKPSCKNSETPDLGLRR